MMSNKAPIIIRIRILIAGILWMIFPFRFYSGAN